MVNMCLLLNYHFMLLPFDTLKLMILLNRYKELYTDLALETMTQVNTNRQQLTIILSG